MLLKWSQIALKSAFIFCWATIYKTTSYIAPLLFTFILMSSFYYLPQQMPGASSVLPMWPCVCMRASRTYPLLPLLLCSPRVWKPCNQARRRWQTLRRNWWHSSRCWSGERPCGQTHNNKVNFLLNTVLNTEVTLSNRFHPKCIFGIFTFSKIKLHFHSYYTPSPFEACFQMWFLIFCSG